MSDNFDKEKAKSKKNYPFVFLLFIVYFFLPFTLFAQPKDNAPYSRLGLGEPVNHTLSSAAFGGLSAAYVDPLHVNLLNPATYGWLSSATFEAGAYVERSNLEFNDQQTDVLSGNLSHLVLAFPMRNALNDVLENKKRKLFWGMSFALLPNTNIGYDIQTDEMSEVSDSILNVFQGTGGTNKLVWGNGIRYKNFSAGINISYLFGQLERVREVQIQDLDNAYTNRFEDDISVRSVQFTLGFQYKWELDKKRLTEKNPFSTKSIIFGLYGSPDSDLATRRTALRIGINSQLLPVQRDTAFSDTDIKEDGKLPSEWTFGVMYQELAKWRIGLEFGIANWGKYESEAKPEQLFDSNRFAAGVEYSPDANSYNNYLKRIRYRVGFYYKEDPRLEDLRNYALTFGFGLPVILPRGQTSFVNLAFELGRFSTDDQINEDFMKMSLGFTLNDGTWFYKRKFR
ncbi:MAG: hypothetical protein AAFZ15_10830 [Bacteroidota bacterium]